MVNDDPTADRVMPRCSGEVRLNGPASISTQAMTPLLSTERTTPVKRLRAE
jgi:hypothetical protein